MKIERQAVFVQRGITVDALYDKIIWLLTTLLFATFYLANKMAYGSYILLAITGVIFLMILVKGRGRLRIAFQGFHWTVLAFAAYIAVTVLWAQAPSKVITRAVSQVEIFACITILYWYYMQEDSTEKLLKAIMWGAYVVVLYTLVEYGVGGIMSAVENEERFDVDFANINAVSMVASVAVTVNVHLWRRKIQRYAAICALPSLMLIGASGSRKALVILLVGFIMIYLLDMRSKNAVIQVFKVVVFAVIAIAIIRLILMLPVFKVAADRMDGMINGLLGTGEADSSTRKRMMYAEYGWQIFKENPILGIGFNNTYLYMGALIGDSNYLHNNFMEVLASGGIIGCLLYYGKYAYLIIALFKAKIQSHEHSPAVMTLLVLLLVMDWGVVSYYSKQTYFYLMLYFLHLNTVRNNAKALAE